MISIENYQIEVLSLEQMVEREPDKTVFDNHFLRRFSFEMQDVFGVWWLNHDWDF